MSAFRFIAVLIFAVCAAATACAQTVDSSSLSDSIPHVHNKIIEVTAQRKSGLATIETHDVEIKPAFSLEHATGATIASDALKALSSSLTLRNYGPLGSIAVPSFRGLPAEYTTIYRDGIQLTNEQLGETDLGQLTLHGISRVELIPASSAVLLGSDAIGAAINLESEFGDTAYVRLGTEQTNYAHSYGLPENEYYLSLATHPIDNLRVTANGSTDESNGQFPFFQDITNTYVLRENNDASLRSANLNAEYIAGEGTLLKFISNYFSAERGSPGAAITPYRGASSLDERLDDAQTLTALKLEHSSSNWSGWIAADYQNQYEDFRGPSEGLGDTATNQLIGLSASANAVLAPWMEGFTGTHYLHSRLNGTSIALPNSSSDIARDEIHGYIAAAIEPTSNFRIAPSLRTEYVSDLSDFELLPQALFQYTPFGKLTVSVAYSRSFHAPTLNDLYWKGLGNPKLIPELANNSEADIEYTPQLFGIAPKLSVTYFYTLAQNQILWLPPVSGDNWRPFNVGVAESKGWELKASAALQIDHRTTLSMEESYTILAAHNFTPADSNYGKELLYSSPSQSLFIASISHDTWGILTLLARYRGHEFSDAANTRDGELPPVTTYDLSLTTRDFTLEDIGFHCALSVVNLTDVNYQDVIDYPLPGRTYKFSIELNYH